MAVGDKPGSHGGPGGSWPTVGKKRTSHKRPVYRVSTDEHAAEEAVRGMRSKWLMGLTMLALAVGLAYAVWDHAYGPDPHYLAAQRMIEEYELGKPTNLRDYRNAVYGDALNELSQVDPDSTSVGEGRALQVRIEGGAQEFERMLQEREHARRRHAEAKRVRADRVITARVRDRVNPVTSYAECDH